MESAELEHSEGDLESRVYEIGFHILPTVPEEHVPAEAGAIKTLIESKGAIIVSDEAPKLRSLSYPIAKRIATLNHVFDKAYFGWIKFELTAGEIATIHDELKKLPNILRFILVKTVKESTLPVTRFYERPASRDSKAPSASSKAKEMSEEEIDKSIESLVIE